MNQSSVTLHRFMGKPIYIDNTSYPMKYFRYLKSKSKAGTRYQKVFYIRLQMLIPDGIVHSLPNGSLLVNARTYEKLKTLEL